MLHKIKIEINKSYPDDIEQNEPDDWDVCVVDDDRLDVFDEVDACDVVDVREIGRVSISSIGHVLFK